MLAPEVVRGAQVPRIRLAPAYEVSAGPAAVELAAEAGLVLDPWQQLVLQDAMGERPDGRWASTEVGLVVARQNGKGAVLESRQLYGLFVDGTRALHSAHEFKTAREHFDRILSLIEGADFLRRDVAKVRTSHGEEGIKLRSGAELRFVARSRSSGRGFSPDEIYLDEALILSEDAWKALLPSQSAAPNPQRWLVSSAGTRDSVVLGRLRGRALAALAGGAPAPRLTFHGYEPPDGADRKDPETWAWANPGLGFRLTLETIEDELRSLSPESFDGERLSIGDYPMEDGDRWSVLEAAVWNARLDPGSGIAGPVLLAADINPEGDAGAIGAAGRRPDRLEHVEVVDAAAGVGWMLPRLLQLRDRQSPAGLVLDSRGRAWELVPDLLVNRFEVAVPGARVKPGRTPIFRMTSQDVAQAHGAFVTAVNAGHLRHLGQRSLDEGLAGAATRDLGDAKAWARKNATVNIAPVVAVTNARWGLLALEAAAKPVPAGPALAGGSPVGSYDSVDLNSVGF